MSWTNNVSERGAKAAKRHQAVSGYWHSLATLARWCRLRSYLDSAAAHGITALDAIASAIAGKPWLPPLPVISHGIGKLVLCDWVWLRVPGCLI